MKTEYHIAFVYAVQGEVTVLASSLEEAEDKARERLNECPSGMPEGDDITYGDDEIEL